MGDAPLIATLYPFGEIGRLCDAEGGRRILLSEIVMSRPRLRGMLCDGEGVIASARALIVARGQEVRIDLVQGTFSESVSSNERRAIPWVRADTR